MKKGNVMTELAASTTNEPGHEHPPDAGSSLTYSPLPELLERIGARTAKVAIVGQGYVGLPVAMRAAELGFPTVGYEIDPARCQSLRDGVSYVEDVSHETLGTALEAAYQPTSDLGDLVGFDIAVITVPTPLRDGAPDLCVRASAGAT